MNARRFLAALGGSSALLLVVALPASFPVTGKSPVAAMSQPGACDGTITSTVSPSSVRICDAVTVTHRIEPSCRSCPGGINVVFVSYLGHGAVPKGWTNQELFNALDVLIRLGRTDVQVGVVLYRDSPSSVTIALPLTHDLNSAKGPLARPKYGDLDSEAQFGQAAQQALRMLSDARPPEALSLPPCEIMVFMAYTDIGREEEGNGGWQRLRDAGKAIRKEGVALIVGCPYPDTPNLESVCSTPKEIVRDQNHFAQPFDSLRKPMQQALADVESEHSPGRVRGLSVADWLPLDLSYIDGSASEPPVVLSQPDGTLLRWTWDPVTSMEPHTVTYRTAPLAEGQHVITGTLRIEDQARGVSLVPMQPITVTVSGLCPPATPTATPTATATHTATPSPSLVATVGSTVTATSTLPPPPAPTLTPRPLVPVYLPLILGEHCTPAQRHMDVVLAIDTSSSMLESTSAGRTKLDAARAAASVFLDQLRLEAGDQAALVTFDADARLAQPLTTDRSALDRALAAMATRQRTCLACAVDQAGRELSGTRHVGFNMPVLVLLTDGRSNQGPAGEAVTQAQTLKDRGTVVFTIGVGPDLDDTALAAIASQPDYFYRAPDAEALAGIYHVIAVAIPCPADAFWGLR